MTVKEAKEKRLSERGTGPCCVYRHISPSGKVYIGITSQKPEIRWGNGSKYKGCPIFWKAIQKYKWKNIKHEVLFTGLTRDKAGDIEKILIRHYKTLYISYNVAEGGEIVRESSVDIFDKFTKEYIKTFKSISEASKELGVKSSAISGCCNRKLLSCKGYVIRYSGTKILDGEWRIIDSCSKSKSRGVIASYNKYTRKLVKVYKSITEASKDTGIKTSKIRSCCDRKILYCERFVFREFNDKIKKSEWEIISPVSRRKRAVLMLDMITENPIRRFDSIKEASLLFGINNSDISLCCSGKIKTAGGFKWKYL